MWRKGNPLTLLVGMQTSIATILVLEKFSLVLEKKKKFSFRKGRGTRDQIVNICWIMEKAREFHKKHLFLLY